MPESKLTDTKMLVVFVDKLLADKGLELEADERQRLRAKLLSEIDEAIEQAIIRSLPDEKLAELSTLTEQPNVADEAIEAVFNGAGVDFQVVVMQTMTDFRERFLSEGGAE